MGEITLSEREIRKKLAVNDLWSEGKLHVGIHRLYLDVICPSDCKNNYIDNYGFCYCEDCQYGTVCYKYKGAMRKFGTKSMI